MDNLFVRSWKGQASLSAAFWLIFFIGVIVLTYLLLYIIIAIRPEMRGSPVTGSIVSTIVFPYLIYAAISVWRCAKGAHVIWKVLARIVVVLSVLNSLYNIFLLFRFYA